MKETGQIKPEDKENFMNQESQTPHKRRVRYKGKYPKKFEEKYKELQPEMYSYLCVLLSDCCLCCCKTSDLYTER